MDDPGWTRLVGGSLVAVGAAVVIAAGGCSVGLDDDSSSSSGGGQDDSSGDDGGPAGSGGTLNGSTGTVWPDATISGAGSGGFAPNGDAATGPGGGGGADDGEFVDACQDFDQALVTEFHAAVDDSNSFASPLLVRELAADAAFDMAQPLPVRPHEFLNFYSTPFLERATDGELSIGWDGRVLHQSDVETILEFAVAVSAVGQPDPETRPDITFLVDTSATLAAEATQSSVSVLSGAATQLDGRSVALLTWAPEAEKRLVRGMAPWNPADLPALVEATAERSPDADFDGALDQALSIAESRAAEALRPGVVFVITGGGTMPSGAVLERVSAARQGEHPVRVVGVGVGPARSYADDVLDELTDRSGGAYLYAPSEDLARQLVEERFEQLTRIAARDVAIDLHFPAGVSLVSVAGGDPQSGMANPADAQNLGADTTMVFHLYLRVQPGIDPCQGIGLRTTWKGRSGDELRAHPTTDLPAEVIPLLPMLSGETTVSPGFARAAAVVRATEALRGESDLRIIEALDSVSAALDSAEDPLGELCAPLALRCDALGGACNATCN